MEVAKSPLSKASNMKGLNGGRALKLPAESGTCTVAFDIANRNPKSITKFVKKDANDEPILDSEGKQTYDTRISYPVVIHGGQYDSYGAYLRFRPSDTMSDEPGAGFADGTIVAFCDKLLAKAQAGKPQGLACIADPGYEKSRKVDGHLVRDSDGVVKDHIPGNDGVVYLLVTE